MRNYSCECGQALFYENSRCLACGAETGFCPCCRRVVPLVPLARFAHRRDAPDEQTAFRRPIPKNRPTERRDAASSDAANVAAPFAPALRAHHRVTALRRGTRLSRGGPGGAHFSPSGEKCGLGSGHYRCGRSGCGVLLAKCANYAEHQVCNRCVALPTDGSAPDRFCDCCRYNQTIPDLSVPGNHEKWYRLEVAKRRLFYDLALLNLPHGTIENGFRPPLSFDFKADVIPANDFWHGMGDYEHVYTGHADGKITINIREADAVERERLRVTMGEKQRTLIGHFRHEIGHYYWAVLVQGRHEPAFTALFGDPFARNYSAALDRYYSKGPPADWAARYVSAYASMHPWEDWAETFAAYLDMVSALETAVQMGFIAAPWYAPDDLDQMVARYQRLGIGLNELSRSLGLLDMVPHILSSLVVDKMRLVHQVCRDCALSGPVTDSLIGFPGHDRSPSGVPPLAGEAP